MIHPFYEGWEKNRTFDVYQKHSSSIMKFLGESHY